MDETGESNSLPSNIQPAEGRHDSIPDRIAVVQAAAEEFAITISDEFQKDQHFWYLVTNGFYKESKRLRKVAVENQRLPDEVRRKLAMDIAVEHAQELIVMEKKAATDGLTGAWSRSALDNRLKLLQKKLMSPTSSTHLDAVYFMMLDVDDFKAFNTMYGHDVGDKVLKTLADLFTNETRPNDTFGRYGGEEFGFIMPIEDKDISDYGIFKRADGMRKKVVEKLTISHDEIELNPKLSMGIVKLEPNSPIEKTYATASALLKKAKNEPGKNCGFSALGKIE